MSQRFLPDAGHRIETGGKGRSVTKTCGSCGTGISSRKRYCGPCYDIRLQANRDANRHKYRKKP